MTIIWTLNAVNDRFVGTIETITFKANIVIEPADRTTARAPDYRIHLEGSHVQIGAAWNRRSAKGNSFIAVSIDDPSFPAPLDARLIPGDEDRYLLIWNR